MAGLNEARTGAVICEAFATRAARRSRETMHARHGVVLAVSLDTHVTVHQPGCAPVRGAVVLVPAQQRHALVSQEPLVEMMFDPEVSPRVAAFAHGPARAVDGALAERIRSALLSHERQIVRPDVLAGFTAECASWLGQAAPRPARIDRRVAHMLEALRDAHAHDVPLRLPGVSEAHLRALFVRDVGVPMRTYRLWRRMLAGLAAFARVDATTAAHAAGFADLAHFSRTCRAMLGESPTMLGRNVLA